MDIVVGHWNELRKYSDIAKGQNSGLSYEHRLQADYTPFNVWDFEYLNTWARDEKVLDPVEESYEEG